MLKRFLLVGLALALLLPMGLAAVWLWGQLAAPAVAQTPEPPAVSPAQTITVIGSGKVNIRPDIARVSIGVETTGATVAEAVEENETQMRAILDALKAAGIVERDIQTTNFSITMERYAEPMPRAPDSVEDSKGTDLTYRVSNMVNVTIRDLEAVSAILDVVIRAGANNIWGVSFTLEDTAAAEADARGDAIADARERAEALAELSGVELGRVMSVSEILGGNVPFAYATAEKAMLGGGPISPGELEIGYQVQVTYYIEP